MGTLEVKDLISNTFICLHRCLARLVLLLLYKDKIVRCPPIAPLKRKTLEDVENGVRAQHVAQQNSQSFTLQSSGRVIRSVASGKKCISSIHNINFHSVQLSV
jgi:hypothetical protein